MAIKYYGACSGSAGSKYDIWLEVTENSYSVENNTSNLSVYLKLKRNDGYSSSAYNLNANENFAQITINGGAVSSTNLKIDTRNSATVTLATWNGNVTHNADGGLTITVAGTFSMSGTSLSGGSVAGDFKCVTIPRTSSFSLNKTSVVPNESVSVNISSASGAFSHHVVYEMGGYSNTLALSAGVVTTSFSIPSSWANAIPRARQGTVSVTVRTYNGSNLIGSASQYFTLNIPATEEFLPDFTMSITFNNSTLPSNWNVVLQNISTANVKINSPTGKYGAQIESAYIICGNFKKSGTEASLDFQNVGSVTIVTRITDTRGYVREKYEAFVVTAYSQPTIIFNNIYRCDSSGNPSATGVYAKIEYTPKISSVNSLNSPIVKVKYKKGAETQFSNYITLSSSPSKINGNFALASSYDFVLEITDSVTKTPFKVERTLSSGNIPFNIKNGGNGAAFGCYSERENELTVGYDLNVRGSIKYNDLSSSVIVDSKFNSMFLEVKNYTCLGLTTIKTAFAAIADIPTNTWVKIFEIKSVLPSVTVPLSVLTCSFDIDKNIKAYMDKTGEVFICSESAIRWGYGIYLSGIY